MAESSRHPVPNQSLPPPACWQISSGVEVETLRDRLFKSFSSYPDKLRPVKQVTSTKEILHTTLGRFLRPPRRRHSALFSLGARGQESGSDGAERMDPR